MEFRAYHFASCAVAATTEARQFGTHTGLFAHLSRDAFCAAVDAAVAASARLQARPLDSILDALDASVRRWCEEGSPWSAAARRVLPEITGFSPAVVERGVAAMLRPLGDGAIGALLDEEFGSRSVADRGNAGRRVRGPRLITHILAGNIPGLGFAPMLLSLALRAAVIVKSAAGDPYSSAAFAASVAAVDPDLGRCLVVHDWRGGDAACEDVALAADVVVASGGDAAIAAMAPRVRGRFHGHGHKVSFALVARDALASDDDARVLAARLAGDVALWDQQGCLSPQLCFVESGAAVGAVEFAQYLAVELETLAVTMPARSLGIDDRAAIAAFRAESEWRLGTTTERLFVAADGGGWSVSVERQPHFRGSCLNRCVRVVCIDDAAQMPAILAAQRRVLECAGLACAASRHAAMSDDLSAAGVHRVCPIGAMQMPSLAWKQSGRPRVADWVEWTAEDGYGVADGS